MDPKHVVRGALVEALAERWRKRLLLYEHDVILHYLPAVLKGQVEVKGACDEDMSSGGCGFIVYVTWSDDFDDVRETVIHELLHIVHSVPAHYRKQASEPVQKAIDDASERAVRLMTSYIIGTTQKGPYSDKDLRKKHLRRVG